MKRKLFSVFVFFISLVFFSCGLNDNSTGKIRFNLPYGSTVSQREASAETPVSYVFYLRFENKEANITLDRSGKSGEPVEVDEAEPGSWTVKAVACSDEYEDQMLEIASDLYDSENHEIGFAYYSGSKDFEVTAGNTSEVTVKLSRIVQNDERLTGISVSVPDEVITAENYKDVLSKASVYPQYQIFRDDEAVGDVQTSSEPVTDFDFEDISENAFGYVPVTFTYTDVTTVSATVKVPVTYTMPAVTVADYETEVSIPLYSETAIDYVETASEPKSVIYYPEDGEAVAGTLDYGEYTDTYYVGATKLDSNKYTFNSSGSYTVNTIREYLSLVLKDAASEAVDYDASLVSFTDKYSCAVSVTVTEYTYEFYAVSEDDTLVQIKADATLEPGKSYLIKILNSALGNTEKGLTFLDEHIIWSADSDLAITQLYGIVHFTVPESTTSVQTITLTAAFDKTMLYSYTFTVPAIENDEVLSAEVLDNGIQFTVTKPETESTWTWAHITETVSGTYFDLYTSLEDLNAGKTVTFVYPFVEEGTEYTFELGRDGDLTSTVTVKAAGGEGEIDFTEIEKLEPALVNEDGCNYLSIPRISANTTDVLKDFSSVQFFYKLYSGKLDWSDTEWLYERDDDIASTADVSYYKDLLADKRFNLFDSKYGWNDTEKLNENLSKRTTYWAEIGYYFTTDATAAIGKFANKTIQTAETTYVPVGQKSTYTVTFNSNGSITTESVDSGNKVSKPEDPSWDGYNFGGWYLNGSLYDFDTLVTSDITLVAQWTQKAICYVSFDSNGGYSVETPGWTTSYSLTEGECISEPDVVLVKEGYTFDYWYLDDENTPYDFTTPVTTGIKLVAHWTIKSFTVTFESDGKVVDTQTVQWNQKASKPETPEKVNYTFLGWYNGDSEYSFDQTVTADLTLTAKWQAPSAGLSVSFPATTGNEGTLTVTYEVSVNESNQPVVTFTAASKNENVIAYVWTVNGSVVTDGAKNNTLTYVYESSAAQAITCSTVDSTGNVLETQIILISK